METKETCTYCGYAYGSNWKNNRGNLFERVKTKDHVIPRIKGGSGEADNIIYCCNRCNSFKGNLTLQEWKELISESLLNKDPAYGTKKIPGQSNLLNQYKQVDLYRIVANVEKIIEQTGK